MRRISRIARLCFALSGLLSVSSVPLLAQYKACFREVIGLPASDGHGGFTFPGTPPVIDGVVETDTGWTNAYRYVFGSGTPLDVAAMQVMKKTTASGNSPVTTLYFSFEINGDYDFDQYDSVILGFDNGVAETFPRYTFLLIQPLTNGSGATAGAPTNPNAISYWQTNDPSNWGSQHLAPGWVAASASSAGVQTTPTTPVLSWNTELSINNNDSGGPNLPTAAGSTFGMYADIVRSYFTGPPGTTDTQYSWPPSLPLTSTDPSFPPPPDPTKWGRATLDTSQACSGVYFSSGDIFNTVTGGPTNVISANPAQSNTFSVTPHNSGASPANQVSAKFLIANFGLPADQEWRPIGTFPNADSIPAPGGLSLPGTVPARAGVTDGMTTLKSGAWTLGAANATYYQQAGNMHQCIRVDLDSTSGDTTFVNRSTWNNFDIHATASQYRSYPAIVSGDYPAAGGGNQRFELSVLRRTMTPGSPGFPGEPSQGDASAAARQGDLSYLGYAVQGCRHTGTYLTAFAPATLGPNRQVIPGAQQRFENCGGVGSYGYLVQHNGKVSGWNYDLTASGSGVSMTKVATDHYTLQIPQGGKAELVSMIEPIEAGGSQMCFGMTTNTAILVVFAGLILLFLIIYLFRKKSA